jgi:hypothetical protein
MRKKRVSTEVRMPAELMDILMEIAVIAGVTLEAVICVALASEVKRLGIKNVGEDNPST